MDFIHWINDIKTCTLYPGDAIDTAVSQKMFIHVMSDSLHGNFTFLLSKVKQLTLTWLLGAVLTLLAGLDVPSWWGFKQARLIWLWGLLYPLLMGVITIGVFMGGAALHAVFWDIKERHDKDLGVPPLSPAGAPSTGYIVLLILVGSVGSVFLSRFLADGLLRWLLHLL